MDAVVLVGGLGTRLRSLISEVPKPMAPVGERPFLDILLEDLLRSSAITRVVLAVGYKHEVVQNYFGAQAYGRDVIYAIEHEPLGTGGGIRNAIAHTKSDEVLILNGDTLFQIDVEAMVKQHRQQQAELTMALKPMRDFERYGAVNTESSRIVGFEEKRYREEGLINGGIYLVNKDILNQPFLETAELPHKFSFETDFLQPHVQKMQVHSFISDGYFIDIGIPEDYQRAQRELNEVVAA
ncbi:MAG: nucleotidyltransferase family protein [Cyanobacteria bacterium P01_D01_bin.36]